MQLLAEFLRRLTPSEASEAVSMLTGRISREYLSLGVGPATIRKALERRLKGNQVRLRSRLLTVNEVYGRLEAVSKVKGSNVQARKLSLLRSLADQMEEVELKWLRAILEGELRIGVNEGVATEALAKLAGIPLEAALEAVSILGLEEAVRRTLEYGGSKLIEAEVKPYRPVKPMLAEEASSLREGLKAAGEAALEPKVDGVRIQVHRGEGGKVRLYSRRLNDVTESLPEIVEAVENEVSGSSFILDGEVAAVDSKGKLQPFQVLMRRFRRMRMLDKFSAAIPVKLYLFDILYIDGTPLISRPYRERRRVLEGIGDEKLLIDKIEPSSLDEAEAFLRKALNMGFEGVMVKSLDSIYRIGRRSRSWLKVKPTKTLDVVVVAADWGHGRRRGWLSNYHLAVWDERREKLLHVGKTFKGLTDEEFEEVTRSLLSLKIGEEGITVKVKPKIVVEVAFNEVQKSPHYDSGFALRFARITKIRWDKNVYEADTVDKVRRIYLEDRVKRSL